MISHILTDRRQRTKQQKDATLNYVERQLEELYGPLACLMYEGRRTFRDLLENLGMARISYENQIVLGLKKNNTSGGENTSQGIDSSGNPNKKKS